MKKNSALCLLAGLAILPVATFAQDSAQPGPHHPGKEGRALRGPEDSLRVKAFQEGARLRRDVAEKRHAYFEAVAAKKDEAAKKSELMAAMDKLSAYQKKQLLETALRLAKQPKDTARELRREVFKARKAYFEAVAAKKDESAKKDAFFAALDKMVAYEKAHVDEAAARFAKGPKDGPKPGMRRRGPHQGEGFGPGGMGMNCLPRNGMEPMQAGPQSMAPQAPEHNRPEGAMAQGQQPEGAMDMGPDDDTMGPMADASEGPEDDGPDGAFPEPQD